MRADSNERRAGSQPWIERNVRTLEQGHRVLSGLDGPMYVLRHEAIETASVGEHLRHCLDFYGCFLVGLPAGRIDYDAREREGRIETDRRRGLAAIEETCSRLRRLPPLAGQEVRVKLDVPAGGADAWTRSTVERELQFLASHTVHHFTVIALILRLAGVDVGRDFGVAASTLAYRQDLGSGAG